MPIRTQCPKCQTTYTVPDAQLGKHVRCRTCAETFLIRAETGSEPTPPPEVVPVHAEPVRRPPPVRRPRRPVREEEHESSGGAGVAIAAVVVLGTLLVLGGVAMFAYYFFIKPDEPRETANAVAKNPIGRGFLGGPGDADGADANERLAFAPASFDQPDAGPRTFYPEAPIAPLGPANLPASASGDTRLADEVLKKVRSATTLLRVTQADGTEDFGTGFFTLEPGLLVTNAHVVGMVQPGSEKPKQVDVVLDSGEKSERTLAGVVVAVDRHADLAVLAVKGTALPTPLRLSTSKELRETQPVFVSGFPLGPQRSKSIAITTTAVDSLHKEDGILDRVQVRHAMLPGNSGGPVVDQRGNVIAVSVSTLGDTRFINTGINYAVPSDKVHHLLHGQITELVVENPIQMGAETRLSVRAKLFDQRNQVQQVALEWWIGDPEPDWAVRPASYQPPEPRPGDQPRTRLTLTKKPDGHEGEVVLPALPQGKAYWLQPVLLDKANKAARWCSAVAYVPPPVLQNKPATLAQKPGDQRPKSVELTNRSNYVVRNSRMGFAMGLNLNANLQDSATRAGATSATEARKFTRFDMGIHVMGQPLTRGQLRQFGSGLPGGMIGSPGLSDADNELNQLPSKSHNDALMFGGGVKGMVAGLEIPLPGKEVKLHDSWKEARALPMDQLFMQGAAHSFDMKYTYLGTRARAGRDEAIIRVDGRPTDNGGPKGTLQGTAWVDLSTGVTTLVRATITYELTNLSLGFEEGSVSGKTEFRLQRPWE